MMRVRRIAVRTAVFMMVFTVVVLLIEAAGAALGFGPFEAGLSLKRTLVGAGITVLIFEVFQRFLPRRQAADAHREA